MKHFSLDVKAKEKLAWKVSKLSSEVVPPILVLSFYARDWSEFWKKAAKFWEQVWKYGS